MIVGPPRACTGQEGGPRCGQPARMRRGRWPPRSGRQAVGTGPSRGRPTRVTGQSARGLGTPRSAAGGSARSVRQSRRPRDKAQKQARAEGRTGVGKVGHDKIRAGRLGTGRTCTSHTGQVAGRSGPQPPGQTARTLAGPGRQQEKGTNRVKEAAQPTVSCNVPTVITTHQSIRRVTSGPRSSRIDAR